MHVVYGHPGAEDAREVHARRPPRGRRRPPLRPHRHRQLQPEDGAPLHRLRPVHGRPGDRRRHRRDVQLPDRLRAPAAATARCWSRRSTCATGSSRRSSARSRRTHAERARADPDEDELAARPRRRSARSTAPRRRACRWSSTCAGSAPAPRRRRASRRTSGSSRSSAASSSTRASTRSSAAARTSGLHRLRRPDAAQPLQPRRAGASRWRTRGSGPSCSTCSSARLADNANAWELGSDGAWNAPAALTASRVSVQRELIELARDPRLPRPSH